MFLVKSKAVAMMALMRCLSGLIEFTAAMLMFRYDSVEKAMKINAALALIGPAVMVAVTSIGLISLSSKGFSLYRFIIIAAGVALIFVGVGRGK